jgi:hypothetical protein
MASGLEQPGECTQVMRGTGLFRLFAAVSERANCPRHFGAPYPRAYGGQYRLVSRLVPDRV